MTLAADRERLYFGTINGILAAVDKFTLEGVWRSEVGGQFVSEVLPVDSGVVIVTRSTGGNGTGGDVSRIQFVSVASGVPVWSTKLNDSERYYLGRLGDAVAAVSQGGAVYIVDSAKGSIDRHVAEIGRVTARPYFSETGLVFGTGDKRVISLSLRKAEVSTFQVTEYTPTSVTSLMDGGFTVGDERGNLSLVSEDDNRATWRFKSGGAITSVVETDDGLLITSLDNFVYLVSDYNGNVIWKRRLTGRVVDRGVLLNGHFVAAIYGENSVFMLDRQNGKVGGIIDLAEKELLSRTPTLTGESTFALASVGSIETYSVGPCPAK